MFQWRRYILLIFVVLMLSESITSEHCEVELKDVSKGIHLTVEKCRNIGTFSIGGLYDGNKWERLTYLYPKPWEGTFLSVKVNDIVYTNSIDSRNKIFMDPYIDKKPEIEDDGISLSWRLPEDILVEERFELIDRGVRIKTEVTNHGDRVVNVGVRLHLDTMLGENDGAPIYIPGDGLRSDETEYHGSDLNFRYWKAYNMVDNPSVISTGILDKESYPDGVIVAYWKNSMYSSWEYKIDPSRSILGDSAVILYYNPRRIEPGETRTIVTSYLNGEPILPVSKGYFGIAEIAPDKPDAIYCPDSSAILRVDVISRKFENKGYLNLEIRDEKGSIVYTDKEDTGLIGADSVKTIPFSWKTPENISPTSFDVIAILYDMNGKELDRKRTQIVVDHTRCMPLEKGGLNWMLVLIPLLLFLSAIFIFIIVQGYSQLGNVEIKKEKDGESVKVIVWNKTKREIKNCVIVDRIPEGAEVDVLTAGVERRDTELIWRIGTLDSDDRAILEYRIKDVEFLPPAVVRWDSGEIASE